MADKTLTALTINSLLILMLMLGLTSFYVLTVNNEGQGQIFDDYPEIENLNLNITNTLTDGQIIDIANTNSNLSADYNPEIAISAADQSGNAISINLQNIINIAWSALLVLGSLVFGSVFSLVSSIIMAALAFVITAYFIKGIRTGSV